jgi:hypothetical protein
VGKWSEANPSIIKREKGSLLQDGKRDENLLIELPNTIIGKQIAIE